MNKVVMTYEALDKLRAAAAGARGVLSALQSFHPSFAANVVRETLTDLEKALEAAREFEYLEDA